VSKATAVAAGARHSCALHASGQISCWGHADAVKSTGAEISGPVSVAGFADGRALAAGYDETCVVTADSRLRCFGREDGFIGQDEGGPLREVTAVALGAGFGCALAAGGTFCWGRNEAGQLGRPLTTTGSANALVSEARKSRHLGVGLSVLTHAPGGAAELCAWGNNATRVVASDETLGAVTSPVCRPLADLKALAVGAGHACALHGDGRFSCWGEAYYGQLGTGSADTADVPFPGTAVALAAPALAITAGAGHTCALTDGGDVFCFGLNTAGQVGPGVEHVRSPQRMRLPGRAVAIGGGPLARHTCAVLADGAVVCWGNDDFGQLGGAPKSRQEGRFSAVSVRVAF
jgi:alpha-tubulin suppressor-like RCC1 family protein